MKKNTNRKLTGAFTLIEIMIVVAIIGLLMGVAIPSINQARKRATSTTCQSNLRTIKAAVQMWALDARKGDGAAVDTSAIVILLEGSNMPVCPGGGTYTINPVGAPPACSLAAQGHSI